MDKKRAGAEGATGPATGPLTGSAVDAIEAGERRAADIAAAANAVAEAKARGQAEIDAAAAKAALPELPEWVELAWPASRSDRPMVWPDLRCEVWPGRPTPVSPDGRRAKPGGLSADQARALLLAGAVRPCAAPPAAAAS